MEVVKEKDTKLAELKAKYGTVYSIEDEKGDAIAHLTHPERHVTGEVMKLVNREEYVQAYEFLLKNTIIADSEEAILNHPLLNDDTLFFSSFGQLQMIIDIRQLTLKKN